MSATYAKTYFAVQRAYYRTTWIGAYSFCNALGLEMLTFDSPNEQVVFMNFLRSNQDITLITMGYHFNIYVGAYAIQVPASPDGFIWYQSGRPTSETVKLDWCPGEPNNVPAFGSELCATIMQASNAIIGLNDYPCLWNDIGTEYLNNSVVCQYRYSKSTAHGMNYKYN